jgi:hypothetical protein
VRLRCTAEPTHLQIDHALLRGQQPAEQQRHGRVEVLHELAGHVLQHDAHVCARVVALERLANAGVQLGELKPRARLLLRHLALAHVVKRLLRLLRGRRALALRRHGLGVAVALGSATHVMLCVELRLQGRLAQPQLLSIRRCCILHRFHVFKVAVQVVILATAVITGPAGASGCALRGFIPIASDKPVADGGHCFGVCPVRATAAGQRALRTVGYVELGSQRARSLGSKKLTIILLLRLVVIVKVVQAARPVCVLGAVHGSLRQAKRQKGGPPSRQGPEATHHEVLFGVQPCNLLRQPLFPARRAAEALRIVALLINVVVCLLLLFAASSPSPFLPACLPPHFLLPNGR